MGYDDWAQLYEQKHCGLNSLAKMKLLAKELTRSVLENAAEEINRSGGTNHRYFADILTDLAANWEERCAKAPKITLA